MQKMNVGARERVASGFGGMVLLTIAGRRPGWTQLPLAAMGAGLVLRGLSGRCALYHQLGISSCDGGHHQVSAGGSLLSGQVKVQQTVTINAPPDKVYQFWRDFSNFAKFSENVVSVTEEGEGISRWVARGLSGARLSWLSQITEDVPNTRINWKTLDDSDFRHEGSVTFHPAPAGRGTELRVVMRYQVVAGKVGQTLAMATGDEPGQQLRGDLMRCKQLIEAGELPTAARVPALKA